MKWGMPGMMRSRYFFNSSVIRQNLRQHGWIGIIYTLGLLFSLPLQLFMNNYPGADPQKIDTLFRVGGNIQMLFIISLPAAAGLFLFRYLQSRRASDLWHSLPLRREHLLTAHLASGLGLLLLPVWLTAAVTAIVTPMNGNMYIYHGTEIWNWCLTVSILTLFLFVFSIFVGICTGQTVLQGIIIYILLILPAALIQFVNLHLSMYLYGYPESFGLSEDRLIWSPLLHLIVLGEEPFSTGELWAYSALSLVFIVFSYILYRKRSAEKSGQAIAFTYFNPLFKAGVMLCAMLLAGTYFAAVKPHQVGWILCSHLVGALLGYIAAEMIIRKTWQILSRRVPLEFAVYGVLLGLLVYIPVSGLTGYEDRVPAAEHITGVYAGSNYRMYNDDSYGRVYSYSANANFSDVDHDAPLDKPDIYTNDKEYIEAVRRLHHTLVTVRPEITDSADSYVQGTQMFTLVYQLDNGRKLVRQYWIPGRGFEPEMKAVMESRGFKQNEYGLYQLDEDVESIRLGSINDAKAVSISDPQEIKEFNGLLKQEILNMSYEDQIGDQKPVASIQLNSKPGYKGYGFNFSYDWKPSFHELESWLVQKGYADKVRITAADILSAELIKDDYAGKLPEGERFDAPKHLELARNENRTAMVKSAELINDILSRQRNFQGKNGDYLVKLNYKNGSIDYAALHAKDITPGLKSLLP
ncbi:DUF6449 domain-containing protein [Paenibacillus jilunlii]|uniref:ABC-2 type transport system permease protein n=1 Tax=Paenibacillus jilunlii TaxID=682956 RepID=A0A1G9T345_9BACL|nr:DUF6449 domain-containing protein [Paenibacillus jilunlii]SDM42101.1 ABC-2 type transport system permease protein [Paenibacillus jilunlii]